MRSLIHEKESPNVNINIFVSRNNLNNANLTGSKLSGDGLNGARTCNTALYGATQYVDDQAETGWFPVWDYGNEPVSCDFYNPAPVVFDSINTGQSIGEHVAAEVACTVIPPPFDLLCEAVATAVEEALIATGN